MDCQSSPTAIILASVTSDRALVRSNLCLEISWYSSTIMYLKSSFCFISFTSVRILADSFIMSSKSTALFSLSHLAYSR